jgi:glycosyltransferase involved in cell wall biosynthesis
MTNKKIKVFLDSKNHSLGRGVGIYAQNLREHLGKINNIELTSENPDIVHYPFFDLFYPTLPIIKKHKTVVTIHDVTPLVLSNLYPKGIRGHIALYHQKLALKNISAVITDSRNSKEDLVGYLNLPREKIHVVYLATYEMFTQPVVRDKVKKIKNKYHLPDKFILTVPGGPNPNKNLSLLAEASRMLSIPLVIVGKTFKDEGLINNPHPELNDLRRLKQYSHIIFPGFIPTDELPYFYHLATLYCQPSLYEGFGLPLLEAMNTNCLIVSSNTASLPEIYPENTIIFDPYSLNSLTKSLSLALSLKPDEKHKLIISAKLKAKDFNWEKTALETAKIYQLIVS